MSVLAPGTLALLGEVSTLRLTTAIPKRGLRNAFLQGPQRLSPGPGMVGPAPRPAAPSDPIRRHAVVLGEPVAGGGEGVVCLPAHLAAEAEMTRCADVVPGREADGVSTLGLCPPTDPATAEARDRRGRDRGR